MNCLAAIRRWNNHWRESSGHRVPHWAADSLEIIEHLNLLPTALAILLVPGPGCLPTAAKQAGSVEPNTHEQPEQQHTASSSNDKNGAGSAHYILGPFGEDSDLCRWGQKLSARGGKNAKERTVAAVARKLAVQLHRLWMSGEVYEPLRNSQKAMNAAA